MHITKNIASTIALSSAFFIGCHRDFDPLEYHRAETQPHNRRHDHDRPPIMSLKELCHATQTKQLSSSQRRFVPAGSLLQVTAWVSSDNSESGTIRGNSMISYMVFLNEIGPNFDPYPKYQSLDPSPESTIKSSYLRAAIHFPLFTKSELRELKGPNLSRERVEQIHVARYEREMTLSHQFFSGDYNGYCKVIGAFGYDGVFNIVEIRRLDLVSP